jgi:hypothetical protein
MNRGETTCDSLCASVGGIFQDGAVAEWTCENDTDVVGVLYGDYTSSKNKLLPGFSDVDNVNTFNTGPHTFSIWAESSALCQF